MKTIGKALTNDNFRIVFEGKMVKGAQASEVMQKLGKLLNKDVSETQKLFSGSKVILKKNASFETCERIRKKLLEVGTDCLVEKEPETQKNASSAIDMNPKKADNLSDPGTHHNETEINDVENKSTKNTKKYFLSKTTQRIHFAITFLYVCTTIYLCLKYSIDPVSPFSHLLTTYILAGGAAWIFWRITRKSGMVANIVFNLSFLFFFIGLLISPILQNYHGQLNDMKGQTNYAHLKKNDTKNSSIKSLQKANTDELATKKLEIEGVIKNHIKELGYQVSEVELYDVVEMGNGYSVYCFLYKSNQFIGAYFICPSSERYVIFNTAEDMEDFKVFSNIPEEKKNFWIRDLFTSYAGFTFPE